VNECQAPRPAWMVEAGGRARCETREFDEIHGPAAECGNDGQAGPCINPEAHHQFVGQAPLAAGAADDTTPELWDPADSATALVLMTFAGCTTDADARALVRGETHAELLDQLAKAGRRQAGPVEWREYDRHEVAGFLVNAQLFNHPAAPGLLRFLLQPDTVLVVASVCCLPQPEVH
jgi:hypothetical protein